MFPPALIERASALVAQARAACLVLATAESCTGGLVAGLLTEVPGSSAAFDRGFVTYSNAAKTAMLGVPAETLLAHGAVSEPVARAMAEGALARSGATMAVAITGVAGPGGGTDAKPVGLVHFALSGPGGTCQCECRFGDLGRGAVRLAAIDRALALFEGAVRDASAKTQK